MWRWSLKEMWDIFLDREAHLFELLRRFADIRKKPQIKLQDILMCVLFMPFFSLTSLLGLDRTTRKCSFKSLFRSLNAKWWSLIPQSHGC